MHVALLTLIRLGFLRVVFSGEKKLLTSLYADTINFFVTRKCQKSEKSMKIVNFDGKNLLSYKLGRIFLILFLTFISLFSLILYLVRFNTKNKRHFLNNEDRQKF